MRKHIPNILTLLNLFCGCIAAYFVSKENFDIVVLFVLLGAFFDFFDGFVARKLNVMGNLGLQLDSLSDLITFGFVPGFILFQMIKQSLNYYYLEEYEVIVISSIGFLVTLFSAYRLAKFNISKTQTNGFIGLPTPANALFIISLPLIVSSQNMGFEILTNPYVLIFIALLSSILMNAKLSLLALKFKNFTLKENKYRYLLLLIALLLAICLKFMAMPLIIVIYILLSLLDRKKT